jgi:4'-phosphopantetheinyl transferase
MVPDFFWARARPPADLNLAENEVHVWSASLNQPAPSIQRLIHVLSSDEQIRAKNLHFEKHWRHFIAARGILRTILGEYMSIGAGEVQFTYGLKGKPALHRSCGDDTLCFNLSHSHEFVIYAVTRSREIGVDLEYFRHITDIEQIAKRFFSSTENDYFQKLPNNMKQESFFNCWTRKEAYLKAIGTGLTRLQEPFDVSIMPGEPAMFLNVSDDPQETLRWTLKAIHPAPNYIGALAVKGNGLRLCHWRWVDRVNRNNSVH